MADQSDSDDFGNEDINQVSVTNSNLDISSLLKTTISSEAKATMGSVADLTSGSVSANANMAKPSNKVEINVEKFQNANIDPQILQLIAALKLNENDKEKWNNLASLLSSCDIAIGRELFDYILKRFPNYDRYIVMYCKMEEKSGSLENAHKLLKENIMNCSSVEIWEYYVDFCQRTYLKDKVGSERILALQEVEKAYNSAATAVGFFIDSDTIWKNYLKFLKDLPHNDNDNRERMNRIMRLREFYKRASVIPFHDMDSIWNDYYTFEMKTTGVEKETEKLKIVNSMRSDVNDTHDLAKRVYNEKCTTWEKLNLLQVPTAVLSADDRKQVELWCNALDFEMENRMNYSEEVLYRQVRTTFLRCLSLCRYCPDLWLKYAEFEAKYDIDKAKNVLAEAVEIMPDCVLLRLAICEFYEIRGKLEEEEKCFLDGVNTLNDAALWIMYQCYTRRNKGMEAAREVFKRARLSCKKPEIYVASAYMEYTINHQPNSALNVFRLGMNQYEKNVSFILSFADFLVQCQDPYNACLLLQKSLECCVSEEKNQLWDKYVEIKWKHESSVSSLKDVLEIEKKYAESYPEKYELQGMLGSIPRYNAYGFTAQSIEDRELLKRKYPSSRKNVDASPKMPMIMPIEAPVTASAPSALVATPSWMQKVASKLPPSDREYARGSVVDDIVSALIDARLPSLQELIKP